MRRNENHVMLCYHVMSARVVYGLATWPYPKSEICRYVFHPHAFRSSLARTWCCFPQCWVVTWKRGAQVSVYMGSWVSPSDVCCFACSSMYNKPKEVSPVPLKKADKSNHCTRVFRLLGKQPTTDKKSWYNGIMARRCFAQCWVVTWNMVPKCLCTWVVGVTNEVLCFCLLQHKAKGNFTAFSSIH